MPDTITQSVTRSPEDAKLRQCLFEEQARRIAVLQAEIQERQEEMDMLKTLILDSHPAGSYRAGDLRVQVKPGSRRVDGRRFELAYPATLHPDCYQLKPKQLSQLEKILTTDKVRGYMVSGKPTVVVS